MDTTKPWYQSRTVWGGLLAIAGPLAGFVGLDIERAAGGELADAIVALVSAAGGLLAIWGRLKARSTIGQG